MVARRLVPAPVHPQQPDLNWDHPDVRAEHQAILRFWFDRGARASASTCTVVKDGSMPEVPPDPTPGTPTQDVTSCTTSTADGARWRTVS
jgi:alpha-glucosidase